MSLRVKSAAQYGVSITPRSDGDKTAVAVIPAHNPQVSAPNISTTRTLARRVAEILLLRIAGRDIGRQVGKICDELLANIAEPHPGLMADLALNSSDASAFH